MRKRIAFIVAFLVVAHVFASAAPIKKKSNRLKPVKPAVGLSSDSSGSPVLATADGKPYTLRDWNRDLPPETRQGARTMPDRVRTLDQLFEPKLLLWAAEKSGVAEDSATAARLESTRRQILINAYLEKKIRPLSKVDTSAIASFYAGHPDDYRIKASSTLRHIQVETRAEAEKVRARLVKGEDFSAMAAKLSTDTLSRLDGGNLGSVTADGFFRTMGRDAALAETLLTLKEGELSPPLSSRSTAGDKTLWHVFRVEQHEPAHMQPLDAVRDQIRTRLEREKINQVYRQHLLDLKTQFHFSPNNAVLADSTLFLPSPEELFRQAQTTTDPATRIRMYEDLLHLYPGSPYAEQAQFMVGFVYSEELSDYDNAEKEFKTLVARYPKSELTKSAQWMLDNMRKGTPAFDAMPDSVKAPGAVPSTKDSPRGK